MTEPIAADHVRQEVLRILGMVLEIDPPPTTLSRKECDRWDSLSHVQIVFALEDSFDVALSLQELSELTDSDAITRHIVDCLRA